MITRIGTFWRKPKPVLRLMMFGFLVILAYSLATGNTSADSNIAISSHAPKLDSSDVHGAAGSQQPWYAVGTGAFNGRQSWAKVYVPVGQATTISITQGCDDNIEVGRPSVIYYLDDLSNGDDTTTEDYTGQKAAAPNDYSKNITASGPCDLRLSFPQISSTKGIRSKIPGHEAYRVFYLIAAIQNIQQAGVDNERSFRLESSNPNVLIGASRGLSSGYHVNLSTEYSSIYQRDAPPQREWDYEIMFAPTCNEYGTEHDASFKIRDADNGVYRPQELSMEIEVSPRQASPSWSPLKSWGASAFSGSGTSDTFTFPAQYNQIYKVHIKGLNHRNTLQLLTPFDQIDGLGKAYNGGYNCNNTRPPTGNLAVCVGGANYRISSAVDPDTNQKRLDWKIVRRATGYIVDRSDAPNNSGKTDGSGRKDSDAGFTVNATYDLYIKDDSASGVYGNAVDSATFPASCGNPNPNQNEPIVTMSCNQTGTVTVTVHDNTGYVSSLAHASLPARSPPWTGWISKTTVSFSGSSGITSTTPSPVPNPAAGFGAAGDYTFTATTTSATVTLEVYHQIRPARYIYTPRATLVSGGPQAYFTEDIDAGTANTPSPGVGTITRSGCIVPPPPHSPHVAVDQVSCDNGGSLSGWAYDEDGNGQISVQIFVGGPAGGSGTFVKQITASNPSDPTDPSYATTNGHRYSVSVDDLDAASTAFNRDGSDYTLYAYAIDDGVNGAAPSTGPNPPGGGYNTANIAGTDPITMTGCRPYTYTPTATGGGRLERVGTVKFQINPHVAFQPNDVGMGVNCVNGASVSYVVTQYRPGVGTVLTEPPGSYAPACLPSGDFNTVGYVFAPGSYQVGDQICINGSVSPGAGYVYNNGNQAGAGTVGSTSFSQVCIVIENEPYVHFFGADVSAGGGITNGDNCPSEQGSIQTYIKTAPPLPPSGSGVQLGALSIDPRVGYPIKGFASALLRGSNPPAPTGLTFANTVNVGGGGADDQSLGGNFNGRHCLPNYFTSKPASTPKNTSPSSLNTNQNNLGPPSPIVPENYDYYYDFTGNPSNYLILNEHAAHSIGNPANPAVNVAIFVKGNVFISHDITFATDVYDVPEKIPSFYLVAIPDDNGNGGNIYIDGDVKVLNGVYSASNVQHNDNVNGVQSTTAAAGGNIYTCGYRDASGPHGFNVTFDLLNNACKNQLQVNGAFSANKVYLARSFGTLRESLPNETPTGPNRHCSDDTGNSENGQDCAAEIFNFTPEIYLSQPALTPQSGPALNKYEYITSLAPIL